MLHRILDALNMHGDSMPRNGSKSVRPGAKARPGTRSTRVEHVETVMAAAERSGLLAERNGRIAGRVSPRLVDQAKRRTGIETDTDLIAFALANVALEDNFSEAFAEFAWQGRPGSEARLLGWSSISTAPFAGLDSIRSGRLPGAQIVRCRLFPRSGLVARRCCSTPVSTLISSRDRHPNCLPRSSTRD